MATEADHILKKLGEAVVRYWTVIPPAVRHQLLDHVAPRGAMARLEAEKFIRNTQAGVEWKGNGEPEADY